MCLDVPSHVLRLQQLLDALGIPWTRPETHEPHEAEAVCSTLFFLGKVDFVLSEDTDVAVYGQLVMLNQGSRQPCVADACYFTFRRGASHSEIFDPAKAFAAAKEEWQRAHG